jgi:hypothetical protein
LDIKFLYELEGKNHIQTIEGTLGVKIESKEDKDTNLTSFIIESRPVATGVLGFLDYDFPQVA